MEQFTITSNTLPVDLSARVNVDTATYPARTFIYKIKGQEFELLATSKTVFDGDITYDEHQELIYQKIAATTDVIGWTVLVVTFLNNLPQKIKSDADLKDFILNGEGQTNLKYWLKEDGGDEKHYVINAEDVFRTKSEINEGRIFKYIKLL